MHIQTNAAGSKSPPTFPLTPKFLSSYTLRAKGGSHKTSVFHIFSTDKNLGSVLQILVTGYYLHVNSGSSIQNHQQKIDL